MIIQFIERYSLKLAVGIFIFINMIIANFITFTLMQFVDDPNYFISQSIATIASSVGAFIIILPSIVLYHQLEKTKEEAKYNFNIDSLTQLLSRKPFTVILKEILSDQEVSSIGLFFIDLDHFKKINDKYGHIAGDKVMSAVGKLLKEYTPKNGVVARYGGEEFVLLVSNPNIDEFNEIAENLCLHLNNSIEYEEQKISFTASVGGVLCGSKQYNYESLLHMADMQMYKAKEKGRNRFELHHCL